MDPPDSTVDPVQWVSEPLGRLVLVRRRWLYRITSTALAIIVAAAVVEAVTSVPVYGVESRHVTSAAAGFRLDVRYAAVSRPAVATPFDIEVQVPAGHEGSVIVAVSSDYLSIWDENGLDPAPSKETASPGELVWEFESPSRGEALAVSFDARIEPAAQQGKRGWVAVLDPQGTRLVSVSFRTRLRP